MLCATKRPSQGKGNIRLNQNGTIQTTIKHEFIDKKLVDT